MRRVFCQKLQEEAEALNNPPFPGELGMRLYTHISKPAWTLWQAQQTMLINEYRLNLSDAKARKYLQEAMVRFLFEGETMIPPPGYQALPQ